MDMHKRAAKTPRQPGPAQKEATNIVDAHQQSSQRGFVARSAKILSPRTHLHLLRHALLEQVEGCVIDGDVRRNACERGHQALVQRQHALLGYHGLHHLGNAPHGRVNRQAESDGVQGVRHHGGGHARRRPSHQARAHAQVSILVAQAVLE